MKKIKLCAAATALAVVTAGVSLTAAPLEAQAADQNIPETEIGEVAVLPAFAAAAAGGLLAAFALGVAQGYMEAKNAQREGSAQPSQNLAVLDTTELDYVLN